MKKIITEKEVRKNPIYIKILLFIIYLVIEKNKGLNIKDAHSRFDRIYIKSPYGYLTFLDYWEGKPDYYTCPITNKETRSWTIGKIGNFYTNIRINKGKIAFLKAWYEDIEGRKRID